MGSHRTNCGFRFKYVVATALHTIGLNVEIVNHVDVLSTYNAVMEGVDPLVGRRKHGRSTAGVDCKVIIPYNRVNVGALSITSLLYRGQPVNHLFMKKEQGAIECPKECKHSFVLPRTLFDTVVSGTPFLLLTQSSHAFPRVQCLDGKDW